MFIGYFYRFENSRTGLHFLVASARFLPSRASSGLCLAAHSQTKRPGAGLVHIISLDNFAKMSPQCFFINLPCVLLIICYRLLN